VDAIELMIRLCRETTCPIHIVHLSCAEALPMIEAAKAEGLPITVETCPHYLTLWSETIPDGDTRFKCAPPIREEANRNRLWEALQSGVIDFVVSDHSPCTPELKLLEQGDFQGAWGGIASLQFGLPVVWTEARKRGNNLLNIVRWMCKCPARLCGLGGYKGVLAPGYRADLVIWDPDATFTITPEIIQHRHKVTPYLNRTLEGVVQETILGGKTIYKTDKVGTNPIGRPLFHTVHAGVS
jgi:allantoinase